MMKTIGNTGMSAAEYEAFKRVLKNRGRAKPVVIDGYGKFLFLNRNGLPKAAANYESMFRGLVKKYNKCHEEALQYIMGHSNINLTLNYYAHATSDSALAEMERLIA